MHNQLLVQGSGDQGAVDALVEAATATGHEIGTSRSAERKRDDYVAQLSGAALEQMTKRWVTRFTIVPKTTSSASLADAYGTIRKYRELAGDDDTAQGRAQPPGDPGRRRAARCAPTSTGPA